MSEAFDLPSYDEISAVLSDCVSDKPKDENIRKIGRVLLLACWLGEDEKSISEASSIPIEEVFAISKKLTENGVFGRGLDHYKEYFADRNSGIAINCDILCGTGDLQRSDESGEPRWKMTESGAKNAEKKFRIGRAKP